MKRKLLVFMAMAFVSCAHKHDGLERGDKVKVVDCFEDKCFYRACTKMTYLDSIALDKENVVWLLAEGCPWYQYSDIGLITTKAVVTMRLKDIAKAQ